MSSPGRCTGPSGPEHLRSVGEIEFAAGMAAMGASRRYTATRVAAAIVGHADLRLGRRLPEVLDAHTAAASGRFRGIRQGAKWDPDPKVKGPVSADQPGLYLEPEFRRGLAEVAKRGLIFEASVFHPQIPDVADLARAVPEASIVLVHSGSPVGHDSYAGRAEQVHAGWLAGMRELAKCPNVTVKLGGILMTLANFDFGLAARPPTSGELARLWRPFIEPCLDLFGPDRCMVASNFPVGRPASVTAPSGTCSSGSPRAAPQMRRRRFSAVPRAACTAYRQGRPRCRFPAHDTENAR